MSRAIICCLLACQPFSRAFAFSELLKYYTKLILTKLNRTVVTFSDFTTKNNIKYVVGKASTSITIAALENALKIGNK